MYRLKTHLPAFRIQIIFKNRHFYLKLKARAATEECNSKIKQIEKPLRLH